jgi:hypothetical protein
MSWESRRRSWNAAQADGPVEDRGVYMLASKLSPASSPASSSRIHTSATSTPAGARGNSYRDKLASPLTSPLTQPSSGSSIPDLQEVSSKPFGSSPTTTPKPFSQSTVPPFRPPPVVKPVVAEITGDPSSDDYYEGVCLSSVYSVCASWLERYCVYRDVHVNVLMRSAHVYMSAKMRIEHLARGQPRSAVNPLRTKMHTLTV